MEKDQAEMKELRETVETQNKSIKRFNRGEFLQRVLVLTRELVACFSLMLTLFVFKDKLHQLSGL